MSRIALFATAPIVSVLLLPLVSSAQQTVPPEKVVGRQLCKVCHVSENAVWEHSSHNTKSWSLLDHPKAADFAKAIGVTNIKGASACTQCHGTQQKVRGTLKIAQGNSCESCHGGAGGAGGWLQQHCDFGFGRKITRDIKMADLLADRAKETKEHRAARDAACDKAGMRRSANAFDIAANCLNCHLVPNEKLIEAGHAMTTRFEFVEWAQGEVRHNLLLDATKNAEVPTNWTDELRNGPGRTAEGRKRLMYVAGQLADLAISLKNRATVTSTKRGSLGDEANDRILDLQEELEDHGVLELKPALDALAGIDKKSLREITANDKQIYGKVAGTVAAAARKFVEAHQDGNKLPAGIDIPTKAKGEAYVP
ncbi:MAG: hypothetical protein CMJ64_03245 [Planctomycetaceae bacterium]|nr:hypothetical protein [Planctomycetaceae bacterium]